MTRPATQDMRPVTLVFVMTVLIIVDATMIGAQLSNATKMSSRVAGQTGWIPLGDLTGDSKNWAAGADPTVDFKTGPYVILGREVNRREPVLPKSGEMI